MPTQTEPRRRRTALAALAAAVVVAFGSTPAWAAAETGAQPPRRATPTSPQQIVVEVRGGGFHWGDAAIGAASAVGLGLLGAAAATPVRELATRRRWK